MPTISDGDVALEKEAGCCTVLTAQNTSSIMFFFALNVQQRVWVSRYGCILMRIKRKIRFPQFSWKAWKT